MAQQVAQNITSSLSRFEVPKIESINVESLNYNAEAMKAVFGEAAEGIQNFQDAVQKFGEQAGKALNEPVSKMEEFRERLGNLEIPPIREENLKKLESSLEKAESKLDELRAKLANGLEMENITESVDDKGYVRLQEQIALTEKQIEALRGKIQEVKRQSKTNWAEALSGALGKVASFAKQAHTALSKMSATLNKINSGISKAFGKFASLGKALTSVSKSSKNSELSLSKAFKMVLRYGLGIRSVYTLINKMRRAIIEGFKNLAQYSDEVNHSISMLKGSFETLKNSSAAALSPLLNAIAPVLNTIIQLCIRATNAINQFLSAIFGKSTWIKAKDQVVDYAESVKGAGKAAKDAMKGLRAFDELNNISLPEASSGGDAGGASADDMFETLPIESKFKDFADNIKSIAQQLFDPLRDAWDSNGQFAMKSWKYALDEVLKLAKDIGRDFLAVWNKEATIKILKDILTIIGDIGLSIGNLAKNFREAWNENEVGLHIFENIRDIIGIIIGHIKNMADETVKWTAELDFLPLLESLNGWLESLKPMVDALSGILEDFYTKVLLPLGKWTLEEGLPQLLQVFTDFNDTVDWENLRTNLAKFWEHLEPFAETIGEGLILFIQRVSDLLADFLNSETFVNFLQDLEDWMDSVTPEDVADGIEKLAKAFVAFKLSMVAFQVGGAIAKSITFLLDNLKALKAIGKIALVIAVAIEGFELGKELGKLINPEDTDLYDNFKFFGEGGFFDQIMSDWQTAFTSLSDMATDFQNNPVIAGLTATLISPWVQAALDFPNHSDKLIDTFKKTNETIANQFKDTNETIKNQLSFLLDNFKNTNETIGNQFKTTNETIGGQLGFLKDNFKNTNEEIKNQFTVLGEKTIEVFGSVKESVLITWENVKTTTSVVWEELTTKLSETWETLKTNASEKFESIKANVSEKWEMLKTDTAEKWGNVKSNLLDTWEELKGNASDKFSEIKTSISNIWEELKKNTSETWNGIKNAIKTPINAIIGFINKLSSGVETGINGMINALNSLKFDVPDWVPEIGGKTFGFNISKISVPKIPMLAKGGIALNYTPAIIGEAGAEAILPLTNSRSMSMIADSIVSNIDYNANSGGFGMSEQQIYNIFYNATKTAIENSSLLREQKDMLGKIYTKPTMEVSELGKSLANDSWLRGGSTRQSGMRLAVASELYR